MEALSAYMRERHTFMSSRLKEGKTPDTAQLVAFLASVCEGCRPLVQADGVPEQVAAQLRAGFASVGWDVKTNAPDKSVKTAPAPEKVLVFLDKAAVKFAPVAKEAPKKPQLETEPERDREAPKKLQLQVTVPNSVTPEETEDDLALQFGAPEEAGQRDTEGDAPQQARQAQDARAAKLAPAVTRNTTPVSARSNAGSERDSQRGGTPGGRTTPGGGGNRDRSRGDIGDWRRSDGPPAQLREDPRNVPLLARAQSEGAPASAKWAAPPPDKWNQDAGWTEVANKSAKGSKTPRDTQRDRGGGGGRGSAPNTPRGGRGGRGGKGGRGGRGGKGGGRGEQKSRQDQWAAQQEETPEVESDDEDIPEPVFEPNSWQLTLQGFWQTSGELGQVVGMGYHRHWTGKVNFTADGKFWMIKTDQKPSANKKHLIEHWSADSGTSGRWERRGPKLLLYWFKWPAEKLKTKDGGQTFHSTQGYKFSIEYEQTLKEWHPAHMPKDFVPAGQTPKGRKKFIMPTREERTLNLLKKYKAMGENLEAPYPEGTEPTEIVTFLISSLFDMYQIMSLTLTFRISKGGARGTALCSELLQFDDAALGKLKKFNLGKFLERNDEKRISALQELANRVWAVVKEPLYACPTPDVAAAEAELERIASLEPAAADTEVEEEEAQTEAEPEPAAPPVDRATLDRKLNGTWAEVCPPKVTVAV